MTKTNESRAQAGDKPDRFICYDCNHTFDFDSNKTDPTSSKGCCKNCGSANWQIVDKESGAVIE